jgi:hypothetical protein
MSDEKDRVPLAADDFRRERAFSSTSPARRPRLWSRAAYSNGQSGSLKRRHRFFQLTFCYALRRMRGGPSTNSPDSVRSGRS